MIVTATAIAAMNAATVTAIAKHRTVTETVAVSAAKETGTGTATAAAVITMNITMITIRMMTAMKNMIAKVTTGKMTVTATMSAMMIMTIIPSAGETIRP
jgi:hypothetical protein